MEMVGEAKFTPGPWSVPHFAEPDVNCECGYVLTDGMMGAVCTVHCSGDGDDWKSHGDNPKFAEACANARLIAAAPDLLAALQELLKDDGAVNCGIGNGGPLMQREYIAAARAAKDAITRATTP